MSNTKVMVFIPPDRYKSGGVKVFGPKQCRKDGSDELAEGNTKCLHANTGDCEHKPTTETRCTKTYNTSTTESKS